MPAVSVVIPVFNKQKYVENSLKSVLNQTFKDFEIIIIDDGSTDNSPRIIEKFTDRRIKFFKQSNQGVSYTRNKGVELSNSPLIAFLDADDYWYPFHLQTIIKLYKEFTQADFFATGYEVKYPGGLVKKFQFKPEKQERILEKFYRYIEGSPLFYTSNFAIKKDIFKKEKGFKTHIHGEDTEFFYRLGYHYRLAYNPSITLRYMNKTENSLFANYETDRKVIILNELKSIEAKDIYMKKMLDLNRFAWSLEYKVSGEYQKAIELVKQIDKKNLNFIQKILLKSPASVIKKLKRLQEFLIKNRIYISPFKKT